ncbi:hypothetical protein BASA81_008098 [Batrachochytrium salamandrivorans]|nr:hypothetical protein BASA81_008098 [Batrachochytrium salamandrivorans]
MLSRNELVIALTLLSSFLFGVYLNPPAPFTKKDILRSIAQVAESSPSSPGTKHVVLGFNANLDAVILNGNKFIEDFVGPVVMQNLPKVTSGEIDLVEAADLAHVFAHHFKTSTAAERSIASDKLWNELVKYLEENEDLALIKLGGNAGLMAEAFVKSNAPCNVTLVGLAGPKLVAKLPPKIIIASGTPEVEILDQIFTTKLDEVHFIFEYSANAKFGSVTASKDRANRFIVSRDFSNGVIGAAGLLPPSARGADLLVLAGVHLMESLLPSPQAKLERIRQINQYVAQNSAKRIHLELASTNGLDFTKTLIQQVQYESLGLNEEEFYSVCKSLGLCMLVEDATLLAKTHVPNVKRVQQVMGELFRLLPNLNRIHYHSFGYHLLAQRKSQGERWPNPKQAVAAGSLRATLRACQANKPGDLHGNQLSLLVTGFKLDGESVPREVSQQQPVVEFSSQDVDFYIVPVVACLVPKQTVGLGDNISAFAVAKQL